MDMDVNCRREDKKVSAVYPKVGCFPGASMDNPAVMDRDICPAPAGKLGIRKYKSRTAFHADMICTGSYSRAVLTNQIEDPLPANTMFF
jgi:hypothetical protein